MKQALVLFPCDDRIRQQLSAIAADRCTLTFKADLPDQTAYRQALKQAQIILGEPKNEDLSFCEQLEWMHSTSSGVNYYINGGCFPEGAALSCMTGCYGNIIAEHLLAMVLSLCRRLPEYRDQQKTHTWQLRKFDKELSGSTLLILGAGDIGTTVAKWMKPMVGSVIGVRRTVREYPDCYDEMVTLDRLEEKLPQADIIVCALPHTPETVQLLDERRLRMMKQDAVLVNGGRGSLIDQEALLRVMEDGWFYGVGLEVTTPEPLPQDHPLWDQPRLIITPHAAGNSFAPGGPLYRKLWAFLLHNLQRYLDGQEPENLVDFRLGYRNNRT